MHTPNTHMYTYLQLYHTLNSYTQIISHAKEMEGEGTYIIGWLAAHRRRLRRRRRRPRRRSTDKGSHWEGRGCVRAHRWRSTKTHRETEDGSEDAIEGVGWAVGHDTWELGQWTMGRGAPWGPSSTVGSAINTSMFGTVWSIDGLVNPTIEIILQAPALPVKFMLVPFVFINIYNSSKLNGLIRDTK